MSYMSIEGEGSESAESSPRIPKPLRLASNLSRKETTCERLPVPAAFVSLLHSARLHRRNLGWICVICTAERNSFRHRVYLSQKHQGPRGVVLLILMFVCFLCFLRDRIVNAITGGGEFRKRKKKGFFSFGENNTALLSFLFAEPVSPFSPTTPAAAAASRGHTRNHTSD